ncbi:aldo/keto reductase [Egibacter rhizosphaerae]|uniref:Aldo/keto reductase n=1 Tax=Egibacter rhizosphaerae TaxID=1670831 RepID=A0A411YJ68_9ACTN|nr:aldo/keto reductase [Egibacter rhizosphaerae]QBI21344.1 aldo/keto reductase [Egibacter rhizosphaerae]
MQQTYLGRSGLVVSELCLGTMTFGGTSDLEAPRRIVDAFREAGGNFFDTADVYQGGRSEEILGELVAPYRDEVVLATKAYAAAGPGPNDRSASRRHLLKAVEASLRRLGTNYIDVYQIHAFDPTTPLEETLATLEDLVRSGKVLYVGVSNFVGWQIERAARIQERRGFDRLVSLQPQYSLIERQIEFETLPAARTNALGVLAWSPLAAGFLSGKYDRGDSGTEKGRFGQYIDNLSERSWRTLDLVRELATHYGTEPAAIALAWLRAQPDVVPIIGATRPEQLDASLASVEVELTGEERARLDEVSAPEVGYPWDFGTVSGRPPRDLAAPPHLLGP